MIDAIDKAIETCLKDQAKEAGIDICNSGECQLRMSQTTFPSGEMLWKIDDKPVLKLAIEAITEDVIVFTVSKIRWKKEIIVANKRIVLPSEN
jgi:hypothetical protein